MSYRKNIIHHFTIHNFYLFLFFFFICLYFYLITGFVLNLNYIKITKDTLKLFKAGILIHFLINISQNGKVWSKKDIFNNIINKILNIFINIIKFKFLQIYGSNLKVYIFFYKITKYILKWYVSVFSNNIKLF